MTTDGVMHPVERAWLQLVRALEAHGWTLLLALALLLLLRSRLRVWAAERARAKSLAEANDPKRVAALQRDAARVRERQQQAQLRASRRPKAT